MAYTAAQYAAQERVMAVIRWSLATGLCPVCRVRPVGVWPDGVRRGTCGDDCMERWLRVRPVAVAGTAVQETAEETPEETPEETAEGGVESYAAPVGAGWEPVGLVMGK